MVTKTINRQCATSPNLHARNHSIANKREAQTQTTVHVIEPPKVRPLAHTTSSANAETQLDSDELFNFDIEVEPVLEELIGGVLLDAKLRAMHAKEMESLKLRCEAHNHSRDQVMDELSRLESEEVRRRIELNERLLQEKTRLEIGRTAMNKAMSLKLSQRLVADIRDSAINHVLRTHQERESTSMQVERAFLFSVFTQAASQYKASPEWLGDYLRNNFVPSLLRDAANMHSNQL